MNPSFARSTVIYVPPDQPLRNEIQLGILSYFQLGGEEPPTEECFQAWVSGLPGAQRVIFGVLGREHATHNLSFRRFQLEMKGASMYEHMRDRLSAGALALWLQSTEYGTALDPNQMNLPTWQETFDGFVLQRQCFAEAATQV